MSLRFEPRGRGGRPHLDRLGVVLDALYADAPRLERWGHQLAGALAGGARLLAAGNGGSAAQAQHLTSELVGRYREDRPAFSAISLSSEASALTAIGNDYGIDEVFARQVRAHGRPGDIFVALSTSGRSSNVVAAVEAANAAGLVTLALTGPAGSPVARLSDDAVCVESDQTATVQEIHLVCLHLICEAFDARVEQGAMTALRMPGEGL